MIKPKERRKIRISSKTKGTASKPRLSVFRSNKYMYAQIIDDEKRKTILGVSDKGLVSKEKTTKQDRSKELGLLLAKKAVAKKVGEVVFDKGPYKYHGRVKAIAQGAREGGLKF